MVRRGMEGQVWHGALGYGLAGKVRYGWVWKVRYDMVGYGRSGTAWRGTVRQVWKKGGNINDL